MSNPNVKYSPLDMDLQESSDFLHPKLFGIVVVACVLIFVCAYVADGRRVEHNVLYTPVPIKHLRTADIRWTYKCVSGKCQREKYTSGPQTSLNTCNMVCDKPQLWPIPTKKFSYTPDHVNFFKEQITFHTITTEPVKSMLRQAYSIFFQNLASLTFPTEEWMQISDITSLNISVLVDDTNTTKLKLETDESYSLTITKSSNTAVLVQINAQTYFGARHALETLLQLIWWNDFDNDGMLNILSNVQVEDAPKFPYRGLMVDTARNFFPVEQLEEVIHGMSASKLNTLHLHLTDAASFPIKLPNAEKLSQYGSYGPEMVYTTDDIKHLVEYANIRGIRMILEVDAPSHTYSGWEWGEEEGFGKLVMCGENDAFGGHLNPDNPKALEMLQNIYQDLLELNNERQVFHIGGDEVDLKCWSKTNSSHNYTDLHDLWVDYISQMLNRLQNANAGNLPETVVLWSSPLTDNSYLENIQGSENIAVQFWFGRPTQFLQNKHKVIFSTVGHWYLDCGFGRWKPSMQHGTCDPYTPWQTFYEYRPWIEYSARDLTLGGEVCLWTEQVSADALHTRLWPRTTAFAERIWSDPVKTSNYDVYTRLVTQSDRLVARGLKSAAVWPKWCSLNPGKC